MNDKLAVAIFKAESVTCTPNVAVPPNAGGVPESIPPVERLTPRAAN